MNTVEFIVVEPVGVDNWRAVVKVAASQALELFVMPVVWYLALCEYGGLGWIPYAIRRATSTSVSSWLRSTKRRTATGSAVS